MSNNNIIEFLNLKDVKVTDVKYWGNKIELSLKLSKTKPKVCSYCGNGVLHYHDMRVQKIKDIPYNNKKVFFLLERVRYQCPNCKKKSTKNPEFLMKNYQITKRLFHWILNEYQKMKSTNDISKKCGVSTTSIFRYISMIQPNRLILPKVLCIDEFKGDSGGEKYQVNISDGENRKIIDILPSRYKSYLWNYFMKISKEERKNVKYFVSDMNRVFKEIHDVFSQIVFTL